MMFKRPSTHYGKSPEPDTPYQRAGQIWDDRIGSARVQARNWRYMAFGSLFLSAGFAAALVFQSARGTVVPSVVHTARPGHTQPVHRNSAAQGKSVSTSAYPGGPPTIRHKPINACRVLTTQ